MYTFTPCTFKNTPPLLESFMALSRVPSPTEADLAKDVLEHVGAGVDQHLVLPSFVSPEK